MAFKVTRKLDDHLDVVNEILRLNKVSAKRSIPYFIFAFSLQALGVDLTDDQVSLPYEEERVKIVRDLKEKVAELGRDVREVRYFFVLLLGFKTTNATFIETAAFETVIMAPRNIVEAGFRGSL